MKCIGTITVFVYGQNTLHAVVLETLSTFLYNWDICNVV